MVSKIELKTMAFYAFHGVSEQERTVGNNFVVNLLLTAPLIKAVETDKLNDTINYASVYEIVKAEMAVPSKLLEHAAGRILQALKRRFPEIREIEVRLSKLNPPFGGDVESASVILLETYD